MSTTPGVFARIFAEPVARKSEVKGYVLDVDAKPVENLQESSGSEISVWGWNNCKRWMKIITHHGILVVLSTYSDKPIRHHAWISGEGQYDQPIHGSGVSRDAIWSSSPRVCPANLAWRATIFLRCDRRCRAWGRIFWEINMGLSENSVPLHPMVLLIIIPTKWL